MVRGEQKDEADDGDAVSLVARRVRQRLFDDADTHGTDAEGRLSGNARSSDEDAQDGAQEIDAEDARSKANSAIAKDIAV